MKRLLAGYQLIRHEYLINCKQITTGLSGASVCAVLVCVCVCSFISLSGDVSTGRHDIWFQISLWTIPNFCIIIINSMNLYGHHCTIISFNIIVINSLKSKNTKLYIIYCFINALIRMFAFGAWSFKISKVGEALRFKQMCCCLQEAILCL